MTTHTNCTHPATKAARAACRRGTATEVAVEAALATKIDIDYSAVTYEFETDTCGRCGGTGTYPSSAWNGVCLKCNGKGKSLTRAGKAAKAIHDQWIIDHLTIPVTDLQPGMRFCPSPVDSWKIAVSVSEPHVSGRYRVGDGPWTDTVTVTVETQKSGSYGLLAEGTVVRAATTEERTALIARIAGLKGTILKPKS